MIYKCRGVVPKVETWTEVEASSLNDAVQDYHDRCLHDRDLIHSADDGSGRVAKIHFAVTEVEGEQDTYTSRIYHYGIWRKGGVKPRVSRHLDTLAGLAQRLGWTRDPEELLAPWDGEESYEEASKRKREG